MSWDVVLGQESAVAYLRAGLRGGRMAHACLLEGPVGVGKRTAALALAEVLLCHRPPAPDAACGACRSCRWLARRRGPLTDHPDLVPLLRFPNDKERARVLLDHEQVIPLETMQHVAEQLHRAPGQGPRRVALIPEAQRMCQGQAEAANSFLKTLEEPPPHSFVVLTSSRPEALLETILSRVQRVPLRRLSAAVIREGLKLAAAKALPAQVDLAVALADGSLGRARELLEGDLGAWRIWLLRELASLDRRACPRFGLALWAQAVSEGTRLFGTTGAEAGGGAEPEAGAASDDEEESRKTEKGWQRHVFLRLLELCEAAFRDALVAASGASAEQLLLLRGPDARLAEELARKFGAAGCVRILEGLHETRSAARQYVRGDLLARVLAGRIVEVLSAEL